MKVKFKEYEMLDGSKRTLVSHVGNGSIIKRFEMTLVPTRSEDIVCPHFLELKWAYGCPFKCAWCYLQGTLRMLPGKMKPMFKDYKKIEDHVSAFLSSDSPREVLNTGEICDSLMGEHREPPFSSYVAFLFRHAKHKVLFLTKSSNVKNILEIEPSWWRKNLIMSWSLNVAPVAARWERSAPPVKERVEAARLVSEAGYKLRIRVDPIVPGYLIHYYNLIDDIFSAFRPERITLGSLQGLQDTVNAARDKSWARYLTDTSAGGKRVDQATRHDMYKGIIEYLRGTYDFHRIALCKEPVSVWNALNLDYMNCRCNCVW